MIRIKFKFKTINISNQQEIVDYDRTYLLVFEFKYMTKGLDVQDLSLSLVEQPRVLES
jgi:hypothetical protein